MLRPAQTRPGLPLIIDYLPILQGSVPEDHCPFFSPPRRTENYLVHNGQEGGLVISAQNLLNFEPTCVITSDDGLINYTIPATDRNATHVVCGGVQVNAMYTYM